MPETGPRHRLPPKAASEQHGQRSPHHGVYYRTGRAHLRPVPPVQQPSLPADDSTFQEAPTPPAPAREDRWQERRAKRRDRQQPAVTAPAQASTAHDEGTPEPGTGLQPTLYEEWEQQARRRPARSRQRKFARIVRRVTILLSISVIGFGIYTALTAPEFDVKAINVAGLQITDEQEVRRIIAPLMGENWVRVRTRPAAERLAALATVEQVQFKREWQWPPRLKVEIIERQAFAQVGAGSTWWVVDRSGVPFRMAAAGDENLHSITGKALDPEIGKPLEPKAWKPVLDFTDALHASEATSDWKLRRIYFDKAGNASVRLTGGSHDEMLIRLGGDRWLDKLTRARQALAFFDSTGRRAQTLNLVSFSRPTWTPRVEKTGPASESEASEVT